METRIIDKQKDKEENAFYVKMGETTISRHGHIINKMYLCLDENPPKDAYRLIPFPERKEKTKTKNKQNE